MRRFWRRSSRSPGARTGRSESTIHPEQADFKAVVRTGRVEQPGCEGAMPVDRSGTVEQSGIARTLRECDQTGGVGQG